MRAACIALACHPVVCDEALDGSSDDANSIAPSDIAPAVQRQLGGMLMANVKIWTPANLVIYNVPLQWRVLCSNGVDLVWGYVCSSFAADACAVDDEECLADAAASLSGPPLGSRRPALVRRGLPRLVRSRANAWLRDLDS